MSVLLSILLTSKRASWFCPKSGVEVIVLFCLFSCLFFVFYLFVKYSDKLCSISEKLPMSGNLYCLGLCKIPLNIKISSFLKDVVWTP